MGDDTGLRFRAMAPEPCWYCRSSGHLPGDCPYRPTVRVGKWPLLQPRDTTTDESANSHPVNRP